MHRPSVPVPALVLSLCVVAIAVAAGGALAGDAPASLQEGDDAEPLVESCAAEMPADYADPPGGTADTIGFVDGYWYDEPIEVDASDGLSEAELERLTARTAARAEALRCLAFEDGVPPVEVLSREELAAETSEQFANVSGEVRRFDNAMLSTMLLVGETNDSVDVRQDARSQTVAGYYSIEDDRIVVVERPGNATAVDERVLVHEVAHALQDQHFAIERPGNLTMDRDSGLLGLIEGDASWIEHRYLERCEADRWERPCVTLSGVGSGDDAAANATEPPNWGLYLQQYQPYSDGPRFVRSVHETGGWSAVNDVYDDPPESALYVMSPDTFGEVELADPAIANDGRGDWERLTLPDAPDYDRVGPSGIGGMVIAPTYESNGAVNVVSPFDVLNRDADGNVSEFDPLNYDQPPVTGWRGGRLAVFADGNDTATVWRTVWVDGTEAGEFADAYEQLLEIHRATAVEDREGVYRFGEDSEHAGAAAVLRDGDEVRIVTAPSVEALGAVSPAVRGQGGGGDDAGSLEDLPMPGFGAGGALVAALAGVALLARRGR